MASVLTDAGRGDLAANGAVGKTLRVLAVTSVPSSPAAVATVSGITGEVTASGYSRQTLSNVAVSVANNKATVTADTATFGAVASGATIVGVWVFRQVGGSPNDASDVPWVWLDTTDLATNGASVQVTFPSGFVTV